MAIDLTVTPASSDIDLALVESTAAVTAVIEETRSTVSLDVTENTGDVVLTVVEGTEQVSLAVETTSTPVSLSIGSDAPVELTLSEIASKPASEVSPTFTYNTDGTLNVVTYADGATKTLTWANGLLTTSTKRASGGTVTATRALTYNASGQLTSVVDS